jgi:arylsulfatase A-like enzyme
VIFFLLILIAGYFFVFKGKDSSSFPYKYPNANVILIVIDTLRADHLGCYGYQRNTSPVIDGLAKEGIIFKNTLAQSSWTKPGTASILSGLYPKNHGANTITDSLAEDVNLLPEILEQHGFRSYAFTSNSVVSEPVGFNQGYEKFFLLNEKVGRSTIHARSDMVNRTILPFIEKMQKRSKNFIYIHYMDPHEPYIPKEKNFQKPIR